MVRPIRGLNALASEIKADTLDLLLLTRLSAWRITFGKWLSLTSQSALLVVAVRGVGMFFLFRGRMGMGGGSLLAPSAADEWKMLGCVLLLLVFVGYYLLEMGATSISPAAENRSTRKRLIGLGALGLVCLLTKADEPLRSLSWMMVAALLMMDALNERPALTASVVRPFKRLGPVRNLAGMLLLPGWPSGLFFAGGVGLLLVTLAQFGWLFAPPGDGDWMPVVNMLWVVSLLAPAAVRVWFFPRVRNPSAAYVVILIGYLVVGMVVFSISEATNSTNNLVGFTSLCPVFGLMSFAQHDFRRESAPLGVLAGISGVGYWLAILYRSLPYQRLTLALLNHKPAKPATDDSA